MRAVILAIVAFISTIKCYSQQANNLCARNPEARREVVSDALPYRYICHIIVKRNFSTDPSTAFLVSPTMLLTAGHSAGEWRRVGTNKIKYVRILLFEHFENGNASKELADITFYRKDLRFGAHPKFCGNDCPEFDYGFFKLPSDTLFKLTGGHFLIGNYDKLKPSIDSLFITGYPSDKQAIKDGSLWNKGDKIQNISDTSDYLSYGIYTETGDSGAPIWAHYNGKYYVVGIHNRGPENADFPNCNGGRKINDETIKLIEQWQNQ